MKRAIVISIIVIAILVVSLSANIYHYGYRWAWQRGYQAGINGTAVAIQSELKARGQIRMVIDGNDMTLVPKGAVK